MPRHQHWSLVRFALCFQDGTLLNPHIAEDRKAAEKSCYKEANPIHEDRPFQRSLLLILFPWGLSPMGILEGTSSLKPQHSLGYQFNPFPNVPDKNLCFEERSTNTNQQNNVYASCFWARDLSLLKAGEMQISIWGLSGKTLNMYWKDALANRKSAIPRSIWVGEQNSQVSGHGLSSVEKMSWIERQCRDPWGVWV